MKTVIASNKITIILENEVYYSIVILAMGINWRQVLFNTPLFQLEYTVLLENILCNVKYIHKYMYIYTVHRLE